MAGLVASLFAPLGWLAFQLVVKDVTLVTELVVHWPLYLYLLCGAGALAATSVIWWIRADRRLTEARLRIERVSRSDAATGLLNAAGLHEALAQFVALATRKSLPLALARISISPSIKGLSAGERVPIYRAVTAGLRAGRRREDLVARLTRGEFAVLMPCADVEGARVAVERMLAAVREKSAADMKSARVTVEVSAGYSTLQRKENPALLTSRAERALAAAKRTGGKRVVCLDGEEQASSPGMKSDPQSAPQVPVISAAAPADTGYGSFTEDTDADTDAAVEHALSAALDTASALDDPLFPVDVEDEELV